MKKLNFTLLLTILLIITSCSDDDDLVLAKGDYENGYFISNQGPFQNGSGAITFVGDDGNVEQNIYKKVNGEDLGNIVQSMTLAGDNAYIIVNNSNNVTVANRYTMEKITIIEGDDIKLPRFMVTNGDKGYVSNWGDPLNPDDDFVAVIDLNSNTVTNKIPVGEGPEEMLIKGSNLYVNLKGGWSVNDQVVMIDLAAETVEGAITVGDAPDSIVEDVNGDIWVLCSGETWPGETAGTLYRISSSLAKITYDFQTSEHPTDLNFYDGNLYYALNGSVYKMIAGASELPSESIQGISGFFSAMKVYNGELYATDAKDYVSEGELKIYDLASGTLTETIPTGIVPGDIVFQD
ncbi:MAG: DUF5074 domain-containing protein [Bacteroidota bacterium]